MLLQFEYFLIHKLYVSCEFTRNKCQKKFAVLYWCWNINQLPVYRITIVTNAQKSK